MGKKLLIVISAIFVVLLVSILVAWHFIRISPQYSLYQVYSTVSNHDYEKFKKYVDVEDITNNVVDKAFASVTENTNNSTSNDDPFYQLGYNLGLGLVASLKPQLKEELVKELKKSVEDGSFKKDYEPKNTLDYFRDIRVIKEGKVASVIIKTQGKEDLKLKMRDLNGYWQIFDMELPVPETNLTDSTHSETTTQAKFGERVDISQGWYLVVDAPEEYKPTGYSILKEGNKYVSVKVTYENTSDTPNYYSTSNLKLKDNKDFSYSDTYGGREPRIESGDLEAKGRVTGYLTFEIPTINDVSSVNYNGTKSVIFTAPDLSVTPSPVLE
jgi:hypothetical protein